MTFSAAALYLVTEKKPDFCLFRIPDGHKVASDTSSGINRQLEAAVRGALMVALLIEALRLLF
jgi:hypothetical protein